MDILSALSQISNLAVLLGGAFVIIMLKRNGISIFPEKKDGAGINEAKWQGEVTTTLEYIQRDIKEIKDDGKAMRERLTKHLDDEEERLEKINNRIDDLT